MTQEELINELELLALLIKDVGIEITSIEIRDHNGHVIIVQ